MATYTWNGSVDQALNTGNNWTGPWPGTTGATDVFVFSGTPTRAPATTTGFSLPAMRLASSYTLGIINLTTTGNIALNGQNTVDGTNSIYIEDGEIFWANSATQIVVGGTNNVPVYVGNNAEFRIGSYLGNNTNRIIKNGPGKLYFVYGTTPASVGNIGKGLTINDGSFVLRGSDYTACTPGNVLGANGSVVFGAGSATWEVENPAGAVSKTFANPLSLSSGGTFKLGANATLVFSTVPSSTGGTLTLSGAGTLQFASAGFTLSSAINFTGSGTLIVPTGSTLSGATLAGSGTVVCQGTWGVTVRNDAPTFTGSITGNFLFDGVNKTFNGNVFNSCDMVAGSSWTFTGASSGAINALGLNCTAKVRGSFGATSGTTYLVNGGSALAFYGSGSFNAGRIIEVSNNTGTITLQEASTGLSSEVRETGASGVLTFGVEDDTACTYSGNMTVNSATGATTKIRSKGTLTMSGAVSGGAAGRTISLNSDAGYSGTIKLTGSGFTASSPVSLSKGTLHLNRAGTINMTGGLTVSNLATVACSSSSGAYAAQLSGALTLSAGAIMQFGAP